MNNYLKAARSDESGNKVSHLSRKTVNKWLKRYDGTLASLEDRSRRPHNSPMAHTEAETAKIVHRLKRH